MQIKEAAEQVVGSIVKGSGAIVIRINTFKDNRYIDIRKFYQDKKDGKFYPTAKGISIDTDSISEIINFLEKAEAEVHTTGITEHPAGTICNYKKRRK